MSIYDYFLLCISHMSVKEMSVWSIVNMLRKVKKKSKEPCILITITWINIHFAGVFMELGAG